MKGLLVATFVALLMVGLAGPDLDGKATSDTAFAEAIDGEKLQYRGERWEELPYAPNEQTPYTGWVKRMHSNGELEELYQYIDGKKDGIVREWYKNGEMREEATYAYGELDGHWDNWYESGQRREKSNWKDGKPHGLQTEWYENGQKLYEMTWKDGKRDGTIRGWYENGDWRIMFHYKDGKYDGHGTSWYENGQKEEERNYKDGKPDGLQTEWHENGQKKLEDNYDNGKYMSAAIWKPNGDKCPVTNLVNGNGVKAYYTPNWEFYGSLTFKDGELLPEGVPVRLELPLARRVLRGLDRGRGEQ